MTEIKQSNHSSPVPIGMNQYLIIECTKKQPVFSFDGIISCSAIVFKCKNGFAGFHYEAEGLLNNSTNYSLRMKQMINEIVRRVEDVIWVICFTPGVNDPSTRAWDDSVCIEDFFKGVMRFHYKRVHSIAEVSCEIDWVRNTV